MKYLKETFSKIFNVKTKENLILKSVYILNSCKFFLLYFILGLGIGYINFKTQNNIGIKVIERQYLPTKIELNNTKSFTEPTNFNTSTISLSPTPSNNFTNITALPTTKPISTSSNTNSNNNSGGCININTASLQQLDTLDGIGVSTAQKIINSRPYSKKEDLLKVSGIGDVKYQNIKDKICL